MNKINCKIFLLSADIQILCQYAFSSKFFAAFPNTPFNFASEGVPRARTL